MFYGLKVRRRNKVRTTGWLALSAALCLSGVPAKAEVVGDYRQLVVLLNYTDDPSEVHSRDWFENTFFGAGEPESVRNWFAEASYDRMTLSGTVLNWVTLPAATAQCADYTEVQSHEAMQALVDWLDPSVDFSGYRGMAVVAPPCATICNACANLDALAFSTDEGTVSLNLIRMTGNLDESTRTFAATSTHEMGHSFGLQHAHAIDCGVKSLGNIRSECTSVRAMGFDAMDLSAIRGHFNAHYKAYLGWFANDEMIDFDPSESAGASQFTLVPMAAQQPGLRAIRIPISGYPGVYGNPIAHLAVEYRQAINFDERTGGFFPDPETGVVISLGPEYNFAWPQAHLVDVHPDSAPEGTSREEVQDAALSVGEWFIEPVSGIGIGFTGVEDGNAVLTITTPQPDPIFGNGFEPESGG